MIGELTLLLYPILLDNDYSLTASMYSDCNTFSLFKRIY